MASALSSLSPDSPIPAVPPTSTLTSLPSQASGSLVSSPPPSVSQTDQTSSDPPVSSTPSNSSVPPPATPAAPPPSTPVSPPPPTQTTPSLSPPPSSAPPPSSPPSPPASSTPPPPKSTTSPPPAVAVSPPPPPPVISSPPPPTSPTTPVLSPPAPEAVPPSPPPPTNVPTPPSNNSLSPPPPPPVATTPKSSHPPPPPSVQTSSPPASNSPTPPSTLASPPPSVPSTSSSAPVASPSPPSGNSSTAGIPSTSALPSIPTEKPTARSTTNGTGVSTSTTSSSGGLSTGGSVAISLVAGLVVLSFLVMAVWFVQKRRRKRSMSHIGYVVHSPFASSQYSDSSFLRPHPEGPSGGSPSPGNAGVYSPAESGGVANSRAWFTYEELAQATDGFAKGNLLGEGGFGCVYKGFLLDGREVAVKQLKIGGSQGEREFQAEVEIISRVHHRHLVSLVGYCISERQRLLVYDYLPNNTLHYHLHGAGRASLDWSTRVKVAAGAARGIAYLHEDCHPRIIHRDIKSSNILLDNNFEARVSDFGLAKLAQELDCNTHVSTRVMGTFGYMAPEYATSGKLTEKSDVYSFGVVLLELITGRKPVDTSQPMGDESLVEWARPLLTEAVDNENFEALVDRKLENNYVASEMFRMVEAAAACVRHSAAKRPRMSQVVRALDSLNELSDLSNGMKPGQSEIFNSRQQSAQIRMFQRLAFGGSDHSSDFYDHSQSSWNSRDYGRQSGWGSRDYGDRSDYIP